MSRIKQLIKLILFYITDSLLSKKITKEKTLLLIRLDAIGDYILFRNFIKILKNSKKYKNYKITLVGNMAWKSLAEVFEKDYIANFIWVDRAKFEKNPIYRYKKLQEITKQGYEVVLNPTYSRSFFVDDSIVKVLNAKQKLGSSGDLSNIKQWQKNISDKYYTNLIDAKDELMFEFSRNREFFEKLLDTKLNIQKPSIKLLTKKLDFELPQKYAILFIGASASFRKWSVNNFVEVGEYLKNKYDYEVVLCGGPTDKDDAKSFKELAKYKYIDIVGKTSLLDFLYIIYNGNLMLSNETSAPHFAISLEMTNVFVISNGNHFGRFTPYPKKIWPYYYPIYHPEIEKNLNKYKKLSNKYRYGSKLDINEISIEMVKQRIDKVLICEK